MPGEFTSLHGLLSNTWGLVLMVVLFGGSIFVHELGHFLAARYFGLKVDRFSIGFGPKLWGWTGRDGVDYRISWIPLGGYVALPQLADLREIEGESDEDPRDLPPVSYQAKMVVFVAGAVFNVIFAFALACVLWVVGVPMPLGNDSTVIGYVDEKVDVAPDQPPAPGPAFIAGLRPGDRIVSVDGAAVPNIREAQTAIAFGAGRTADGKPEVQLAYERAGQTATVTVHPVLRLLNARSGDALRDIGIGPLRPAVVGVVYDNSPALAAGLHPGDKITALDGKPILTADQFLDEMSRRDAAPLTLEIRREDAAGQETVQQISLQPVMLPRTLPLATVRTRDGLGRMDFLPEFNDQAVAAGQTSPASPVQALRVANLEGDVRDFGALRLGDIIATVNDIKPASVQGLVEAFQKTPAGGTTRVRYLSEKEYGSTAVRGPVTAEVTPAVLRPTMGIGFQTTEIGHPTPARQFRNALVQTVGMLKALANRNSDIKFSMMSGAVGIGRILHQFSLEDVRLALWITVIINLNLAILNLLPIPILDGGHMLLATIVRLRGRALPPRFVVATQGVFLVLLLGLMLYVTVYDSLRWSGDAELERRIRLQSSPVVEKLNFPAPAAAPAPAGPAPAP